MSFLPNPSFSSLTPFIARFNCKEEGEIRNVAITQQQPPKWAHWHAVNQPTVESALVSDYSSHSINRDEDVASLLQYFNACLTARDDKDTEK